jgi:hypothetical protein
MAREANDFFQAAWVVEDLDKSVQRWLTTTKVGPFFMIRHVKAEQILYRGRPATLDFSTAIVQAGPIQIELIEQHNDGPSAYRDVFPQGREGFHHMCMMTHSFDSELERHRLEGSEVATQGVFGDMRFAYVDTRPRIGHMTEIIENRASIRDFFKIIADGAADWDGTDPIRVI